MSSWQNAITETQYHLKLLQRLNSSKPIKTNSTEHWHFFAQI